MLTRSDMSRKEGQYENMKEMIKRFIYPDKSFYVLTFSMAIPILCQNLITIGVNITDTMMLGMLGETQLSASSLANQYVNTFQIFCMGTSMGASVLAARYWGMKELVSLRKTITIMFRFLMALAVIFFAFNVLMPAKVMGLYTDDGLLVSEGIQYLKFAAFTYFLHGLSQGSTIIMRSVGKVKIPLYTSIGAFLLNIVGNDILIFGKLGLPAMGIAGASLSTLIVRVFECGVNFGYLLFAEHSIGFRPKDLFLKTGDLLREYIKISLPVLFSDGFMAFGENAVMMIVGRMGESFVAAYAIVAVVNRMCTSGIGGVGQASAMITGKTLGEGDREKTMRQGYAFVGIGMLLGAVGAVLILLLCEPIVFLYGLSADTADAVRQMIYAASIIMLFQSSNGILTKGTLRGGGDTKVLMVADSIFLWLISVPLGYVSGLILGFPVFAVYFALKADNLCKTVWAIHRLGTGKWIKRIRIAGE